MGLFDIFNKKKNEPKQDTNKRRYWLDSETTLLLPETWDIFNLDRFQAKSPDGKTVLNVANYKNQEEAQINQSFFENLKLDDYKWYQQEEGFSPADEVTASDHFISMAFEKDGVSEYHFTTAKKERDGGVVVTEFLMRDPAPFSPEKKNFLLDVGQSIQYVSDFAKMFAEKIQSKYPEVEVLFVKGMEVEWKFKGEDQERTSFLDNAYAEYMHKPTETLENIIERYISSAVNAAKHPNQGQDAPLKNHILPLIKDKLFVQNLKEIDPNNSTYYEPFNQELYVVYAENSDTSLRLLSVEDIEKLNLSSQELRKLATDNLKHNVEVTVQGEGKRFMVIADGTFEASFILIPEVWTKENFPVDGNIVIGVPSREVLVATGSLNTPDLNFLKSYVAEVYQSGNHIISEKLFEIEGDDFIAID